MKPVCKMRSVDADLFESGLYELREASKCTANLHIEFFPVRTLQAPNLLSRGSRSGVPPTTGNSIGSGG
jgi:hypothetical protein